MSAQSHTQPAITDEQLSDGEVAQAQAEAPSAPASANDNEAEPSADDAAREPIMKPEDAAVAPTHEAVMPMPPAQLPTPAQTVAEAKPSEHVKAEHVIILPSVLTKAEQNLAAHIGSAIDPLLEANLVLHLSTTLQKDKTNLVLGFEGDMVPANPAVLAEQVIAALHTLPAMQPLLTDHHHTPHMEFHDGKLQVAVPHLTTAQYAHLVQALATANLEKTHAEAPMPTAANDAQAPESPATSVASPVQHLATVQPQPEKAIAG